MTWVLSIILVSSIFILMNSKRYNDKIGELLENQYNYREKVEEEYYKSITELAEKIEDLEKENEKLRWK